MHFLSDRAREYEVGSGPPLQIMYGIDGRHDLEEIELDHFEGYCESRPVRIGNGAADQLQLDIYGELIDSIYLYNKFGAPISYDLWKVIVKLLEYLTDHWRERDEGIWEVRGGKQEFTYSRLMSWVAFERAARMARQRGLPGPLVQWLQTRDEIFHEIMERGWSEKRQAFVQTLDGHALDASNLLMPLVRFIAPTDPRMLSTLDAIGEELVSDSLVYRYAAGHAAFDGLDGDEGTFSICSFWWVEALARAGRLDEARLAFEKMLTYANHLGLYSEEIGTSRRGARQLPAGLHPPVAGVGRACTSTGPSTATRRGEGKLSAVSSANPIDGLRARLRSHGYHLFLTPGRPSGWWVTIRDAKPRHRGAGRVVRRDPRPGHPARRPAVHEPSPGRARPADPRPGQDAAAVDGARPGRAARDARHVRPHARRRLDDVRPPSGG